jgi:hypothetical protein
MQHDLIDPHYDRGGRRRPDGPARQQSGEDSAPLSAAGNRAFASLVQRATDRVQGAGPLDPEIASEIDAARAGGTPLDDTTKAEMEGHLGADLSSVRLHTDSTADHLNRSVQAEAFTTGSDIFFRSGKYDPGSADGRGLLAHELTHVVQQSSGSVGGGSRVSDPADAHEREAKAVGDAVAASPAVDAPSSSGMAAAISRSEMPEEEDEAPTTVDAAVARQEEELSEGEEV